MNSSFPRRFFQIVLIPCLFAAALAGAQTEPATPPLPPVDVLPPPVPPVPEVAAPTASPDTPPQAGPAAGRTVRPVQVLPGIGTQLIVPAGQVHSGDAIAILGDAVIDGRVTGDLVVVSGNVTINGEVDRDVVVILGNLTLGPGAIIGGEGVLVGGTLESHPGARSRVPIVHVPIGNDLRFSLPRISALWTPPGIRALWVWMILATVVYTLIALAFPGGVRSCGDTLVRRPAASLFTAVLGILAVPVIFALLVVSVIGIPVALVVLPMSVLLCLLFGKAAILALIGRGLSGDRLPMGLAVVAGSLLVAVFYFVPLLAFAVSSLIAIFGFGAALATVMARKPRAAVPPPVPPAPPPMPAFTTHSEVPPSAPAPAPESQAAFRAQADEPPAVVTPEPSPAVPLRARPRAADFVVPPGVPPVTELEYMPRAGFWRRLGAIMIDLVVVGIPCFPLIVMSEGDLLFLPFPMLVIYAVLMWRWRGTTIGGIICNFQVRRLNNERIDLATATIRMFGCFLSAAVVFLGFIWIAVDADKQAWHDKIAGTVVIVLPRARPLV